MTNGLWWLSWSLGSGPYPGVGVRKDYDDDDDDDDVIKV